MTTKIDASELDEAETSDFHVVDGNSEAENRRSRLRAALRRGGGNKVVSEKSGVSISTLGGYVAGGDMKLSNLLAIAKACDVHVGWLAAGEGPMFGQPRPQLEPQKTASERPAKAFATIKVDMMAQALEAARETFEKAGAEPLPRELVQVMLLIYDGLNKP